MELEFQNTSNYVCVRGTGRYSIDTFVQIWSDLFDHAASEGKHGILLDLRDVTGPTPTTMDRFSYGEEVARVQANIKMDIALAVVGNEPLVEPGRFAELVGRNRSAHLRVFDDFDEAVVWLESEVSRA